MVVVVEGQIVGMVLVVVSPVVERVAADLAADTWPAVALAAVADLAGRLAVASAAADITVAADTFGLVDPAAAMQAVVAPAVDPSGPDSPAPASRASSPPIAHLPTTPSPISLQFPQLYSRTVAPHSVVAARKTLLALSRQQRQSRIAAAQPGPKSKHFHLRNTASTKSNLSHVATRPAQRKCRRR